MYSIHHFLGCMCYINVGFLEVFDFRDICVFSTKISECVLPYMQAILPCSNVCHIYYSMWESIFIQHAKWDSQKFVANKSCLQCLSCEVTAFIKVFLKNVIDTSFRCFLLFLFWKLCKYPPIFSLCSCSAEVTPYFCFF